MPKKVDCRVLNKCFKTHFTDEDRNDHTNILVFFYFEEVNVISFHELQLPYALICRLVNAYKHIIPESSMIHNINTTHTKSNNISNAAKDLLY